ncbi:MAG: carbohydrate-binding protein, partial [Planctomycetota bacterium]
DVILEYNNQPGMARNPTPTIRTFNVDLNTSLDWTAGDRTTSHNIYFGTDTLTFRGNQAGTSYSPPTAEMQYEQNYQWRIDEVNGGDVTTGTVWTFTLQEDPANPPQDVIVQIETSQPYFLDVTQGFARANHLPIGAATDYHYDWTPYNQDNKWRAQHDYQGCSDLKVFTSVGSENTPTTTVSVSGLVDDAIYRVYGRYVTNTGSSNTYGILMGLSSESLTLYDRWTAEYTVLRDYGSWEEWEVLIDTTPASADVIRVYIDNDGLNGAATFSGLRLEYIGPPQGPYYGTPSTIPGLIQAEDYDLGPEGYAYHDTIPGNEGGAYRNDDVDVENTLDVGGGYNLGWIATGEWIEYTVNIPLHGLYDINLRVAANPDYCNSIDFHMEMDGVDVTGPHSFTPTTSWQDWKTVTISNVELNAGQQVLRLSIDSDFWNINWIEFALLAAIVPSDFDKDGDVDQEDFGHLQKCISGSGIPQHNPECLNARLDGDQDVDLNDYNKLKTCISGANIYVDPECAN